MACGCRSRGGGGDITAAGATIQGYRYTAPGGTVTTFLTYLEAKREMRRNGGGTVTTITSA